MSSVLLPAMDTRGILVKLHAERDRLNAAIAAMERLGGTGKTQAHRAAGTSTVSRRRGRMSAAARKRLSDLLKKRWAQGKMGRRASKK